MRHTTTITSATKANASKTLAALLSLALLAACSADNADEPSHAVTIDIPVEIYSANAATTRAADQGDPGNDASLQAPLHLYVYAYVSEINGSIKDHELLKQTFTFTGDELASAWTKRDANTTSERWVKNVRVTFNIARTFDNTLGASRVYAIASRDDLSGVLPTSTDMSTYTTKDALEAMTADLKGFTSSQLKDIYSTPKNDQSTPDNGIIVSNNNTLTCSTVKLYHVAAKADFTWEVPESLRKTVAMQRIECTGLPTTCKIFEPTDNPTTTTTTSVVLDVAKSTDNPAFVVNEGNKWLGRAYAYVLQPPSPGTINYTVTYEGIRQNTTGSITPSTDAYSSVFTGWYRVIATVK